MTALAKGRTWTRLRDFSIYIAVGLLLGAIAWVIASTNLNPDVITRWGGLAASTAVVYGYFIADSRASFGRRTFWVTTSAARAAHLTIFTVVLTHVAQWKLPWFMVMLLEIPILTLLPNRVK